MFIKLIYGENCKSNKCEAKIEDFWIFLEIKDGSEAVNEVPCKTIMDPLEH